MISARSLARLLALVLVVLTTLGVAAAPAAQASASVDYAAQAFTTTNAKRAAHGLDRLGQNECLRQMAVAQAKAMAAKQQMFHQDIARALDGCKMNLVGENVAYGYDNGRAVVSKGWMRSPGHRANILEADYRLMGIAARKGADGRWYVAQVFGRAAVPLAQVPQLPQLPGFRR